MYWVQLLEPAAGLSRQSGYYIFLLLLFEFAYGPTSFCDPFLVACAKNEGFGWPYTLAKFVHLFLILDVLCVCDFGFINMEFNTWLYSFYCIEQRISERSSNSIMNKKNIIRCWIPYLCIQSRIHNTSKIKKRWTNLATV